MDILTLIKNRKTIRKYKNKPIPKKILDKIIEAGVWGPSLLALGLQPWRFIVIQKKTLIKEISGIILNKSKEVGAGGNIVLHSSANTISNAKVLIVVYNSSSALKLVKRFHKIFEKFAKSAELSAISAAIQNMILVAEDLGIGSCWLDAPLFCKEKINGILNTKEELVAILSLGYPAEEGRRSPRKPREEIVIYK